jgi:hypothetical protein
MLPEAEAAMLAEPEAGYDPEKLVPRKVAGRPSLSAGGGTSHRVRNPERVPSPQDTGRGTPVVVLDHLLEERRKEVGEWNSRSTPRSFPDALRIATNRQPRTWSSSISAALIKPRTDRDFSTISPGSRRCSHTALETGPQIEQPQSRKSKDRISANRKPKGPQIERRAARVVPWRFPP